VSAKQSTKEAALGPSAIRAQINEDGRMACRRVWELHDPGFPEHIRDHIEQGSMRYSMSSFSYGLRIGTAKHGDGQWFKFRGVRGLSRQSRDLRAVNPSNL